MLLERNSIRCYAGNPNAGAIRGPRRRTVPVSDVDAFIEIQFFDIWDGYDGVAGPRIDGIVIIVGYRLDTKLSYGGGIPVGAYQESSPVLLQGHDIELSGWHAEATSNRRFDRIYCWLHLGLNCATNHINNGAVVKLPLFMKVCN